MKKHSLTATALRAILSVSLFVITGIGITLFSFAHHTLKSVAVETSHTVADASASQNNLQNLKKLQQYLASKQDIVNRAASIVADSQSYQYQNQIINDLNDYAGRAGLAITNIDFAAAADATGSTPAGTAPVTTPAAPVAGVKSTSVSITLKNPVDYNSMLRFIKSIEQNLTKMQISSVGLSKDTTNATGVASTILNIEVYIK
jgi:hypothetical protein